MKKHLFVAGLLALLLTLLLAVPALAITEHPVDFDRVSLQMPEGLVYTRSEAGNTLTVTIDAAATNWERVMLSEHGFGFRACVSAPGQDKTGSLVVSKWAAYSGTPDFSLEQQLGFLRESIGNKPDNLLWSNGSGIGSVDENSMAFLPDEWEDTNLICWHADGEYSQSNPPADEVCYYERLNIRVRFTDTSSVNIPLRNAPASMLAQPADQTGWVQSIDVTHGEVTYTMKPEAFDQSGTISLPFHLTGPEDAAVAELVFNGETFQLPVTNGQTVFENEYDENNNLPSLYFRPGDLAQTYECTVKWMNGTDEWAEMIDYGQFTIYVTPEDRETIQPYPCYVADWQPVPNTKERLSITNSGKNVGLTATYLTDENNNLTGVMHIDRDDATLPTGNPGKIVVHVKAPQDAKYYRFTTAGGGAIMGNSPAHASGREEELLSQPLQRVTGSGVKVIDTEPLRREKAGPVDVYLQQEMPTVYGGGVVLIWWYRDGENTPFLKEYICETTGEMFSEETVKVVSSESEITAPVTKPTAVQPEGCDWEGWQLVVRSDPQYGQKAKHYELYLVNETESPRAVKLTGGQKLVIYMPYPDKGNGDYYIYHFNSEYDQHEKFPAEKHKNGLRFEVTSLSPFVVSWGEEPVPPQTGDHAPLMPAGLLMVLSFAAALLLRKRRSA